MAAQDHGLGDLAHEPHNFRARPGRPRAGAPAVCRRCGLPRAHGVHDLDALTADPKPAPVRPEVWLSAAEVAARYFPGKKARQVAAWAKGGLLPGAKKIDRAWLIPESAVANFGREAS